MKLIDADALKEGLKEKMYGHPFERTFLSGVVDSEPTIDAVRVVRCRDCKHWKPTGSKAGKSFSDMEYIGGCEFTKYCRRESDFCSYGERKEGADNG